MRILACIAVSIALAMPAFANESGKDAPLDTEQSDMAKEEMVETPDVEAGTLLYAEGCAQCHGRAGRGMASFPSLMGREIDYLSDRLEQYRAGKSIGPNSALMMPVAAELSDEEIANLAAYISEEFR